MNTGVEGRETAVKITRKCADRKKGVPDNQAKVLFTRNKSWGRTLAAISTSNDPIARAEFGPYVPGFEVIPYDDLAALEQKLEAGPTIAGFLVEPIQGEAGVVDPASGVKTWDLCVGLKDSGVLAKPTHDHIIRIAPPLVIPEEQQNNCLGIIGTAFQQQSASAAS